MLSSFSRGRLHLSEGRITFLYSLIVWLTPSSYSLKAGAETGIRQGSPFPLLEKYHLFVSEIALPIVPERNPVISKSCMTFNRYFCFPDLNSLLFKKRQLDFTIYRGDPVVRAELDMVHNVLSTVLWIEGTLERHHLNIYNHRSCKSSLLVCCCCYNKLP